MRGLEAGLRAGLDALQLRLSDLQVARLLDYLALLQKWNRVHNLTAVREPAAMLTHHVLDCLSIIDTLHRETGGSPFSLLDVGSGAGLPGAVIAICRPDAAVTCLDAVGKKAAFVQQAALTLGLVNLRGRHGRIEAVAEGFDVVSSRAFAALDKFVGQSAAALAPGGVWLAMKGKRPDQELALLPATVVFHVEQLDVPGLEGERCAVWIRRKSEAPQGLA